MRPLAAVVVLCVLLSGCGGGQGEDTTPTTPGPTTPGPTAPTEPTAERPEWTLREGWRYAVEVPGQPTRQFNMVVAEKRNDLWVVASDDRTQAIHHAVYSTNPVLGRIGTETLSPFQDGRPVTMYSFPLTDGKAWSAPFFGETMNFVASFEAIDVNPGLGLGEFVEGFRIEASGPSGQRVLYDYVDGAQWFTSFELRDATGARQIKLTLVDLIKGYSGPYHFYRGGDALVNTTTHTSTQGVTTESRNADVPSDRSDRVALGIVVQGKTGSTAPPSANLTLSDPDGTVVWSQDFQGAGQKSALADFAGKAGAWKMDYRLTGDVTVEVRVVGILLFAEGTL